MCVGHAFVILGDVNWYFDGLCLFRIHLKTKEENMDLRLCKKTHQSLVIELRQMFRGLGDEMK